MQESNIKGPEDLPGKRIAVNSVKNLGDVTIPVALKNKGIDPKGIEWVPMNFSDMGAALERGDVDAIWQHWFSQPLTEQVDTDMAERFVDELNAIAI